MKNFFFLGIAILTAVLVSTCTSQATPTYSFEVLNRYPHDQQAFTQGLAFFNGFLYEGTGLYGSSSLRKVRVKDGEVLEQIELEGEFFGEGITILDDRIFQLTWREGRGFVYTLQDFRRIEEFGYPTQGWGLTTDGEYLIMSDGSHALTFLDPTTFERVKEIQVYWEDGPLTNLNELEYVAGEIWANVWFSNFIYRIDPLTGRVVGLIDFSDLYALEKNNNPTLDVLNGIAYDPLTGRIFVTGKLWSSIYEIRLISHEQENDDSSEK